MRAYFTSTVHPFRVSGLTVRFERSEIIGGAAKQESQYFGWPGLQQPKPLQRQHWVLNVLYHSGNSSQQFLIEGKNEVLFLFLFFFILEIFKQI